MKLLSKSYAWGVLSGIVITLLVAGGLLIGSPYLFKRLLIQQAQKRLIQPPIVAGEKADFQWQVQDRSGKTISLAALQGKTVILTFWNPGCIACVAQLSALERLYQAVQNEGVEVVAISHESGSALELALADQNVRFPVYSLAVDPPKMFQYTSLPTTFIVAPNGDIVFKHVGAARWDDDACVLYLKLINQREPGAS